MDRTNYIRQCENYKHAMYHAPNPFLFFPKPKEAKWPWFLEVSHLALAMIQPCHRLLIAVLHFHSQPTNNLVDEDNYIFIFSSFSNLTFLDWLITGIPYGYISYLHLPWTYSSRSSHNRLTRWLHSRTSIFFRFHFPQSLHNQLTR